MKGKPVSTPILTENVKEFDETPLSPAEAQKYRSVAARLNFLAQDRPDLQFASRTVAKHMTAPTFGSMEIRKRIGRYLRGAARKVQHFQWGAEEEIVDDYIYVRWAWKTWEMKEEHVKEELGCTDFPMLVVQLGNISAGVAA